MPNRQSCPSAAGADWPVPPEISGTFALTADDVQALAEEVGAPLVWYAKQHGELDSGVWLETTALYWKQYFYDAFGAQTAPEDGIVLGDLMFKDTARHRMSGETHLVTVKAAEVEMYLWNAFGPSITAERAGLITTDGTVTFDAPPDDTMAVVQLETPWEEAEAGPKKPLVLRYMLGTSEEMTGPAVAAELWLQESPESPYGCFVTGFCATAETT